MNAPKLIALSLAAGLSSGCMTSVDNRLEAQGEMAGVAAATPDPIVAEYAQAVKRDLDLRLPENLRLSLMEGAPEQVAMAAVVKADLDARLALDFSRALDDVTPTSEPNS